MTRRALITGITGQDGSYLAEFLLGKGYEVHGLIRRSSTASTERLKHIYGADAHGTTNLHMHYGDMDDGSRLATIISQVAPAEVYNLAAQSHVRVSFDEPVQTTMTNAVGSIRLLEAIRVAGIPCRVYQASTSEMFGAAPPPQSETTPFCPRSPYGVAKLYAYWMVRNYREAHGIFAVNGILFNHESPRRGEEFVTRKITKAVARIRAGKQKHLYLGNLNSIRDWGYAPEYVEGMWQMLQAEVPCDYVLATGKGYSVRQFVETAFSHAGLDWREYVRTKAEHFRPAEVDALIGDASRAYADLGWKSRTYGDALVRLMVDADIEAMKNATDASSSATTAAEPASWRA